MDENPYRPPAARVGPAAERGSVTSTPLKDATATASLWLGGGSVLLAVLTLLPLMSFVNLRTDLDLIFASSYTLMGVTGLVAASALICGIIGWNSERWPRAMFGVLLAFLGLCLTVAIATSIALGGPR